MSRPLMTDASITRFVFARGALLDHLQAMDEARRLSWSRQIEDAIAEIDRIVKHHTWVASRSRR